MSNQLQKVGRTLLAGLFAFLPLAIALAILLWVSNLIIRYIGPESAVGEALSAIGLSFVSSPAVAYLLGALLLLAIVFCLGLFVQSRAVSDIGRYLDGKLKSIPVFGQLYGFSSQFVGMFQGSSNSELAAMQPVWVNFGGQEEAAVLALMPSSKPVHVEGTEKVAVIIPMSPVPVGGGLVFVPRHWVRPADVGVEALTSVYVSMGLTAPEIFPKPDTSAAS